MLLGDHYVSHSDSRKDGTYGGRLVPDAQAEGDDTIREDVLRQRTSFLRARPRPEGASGTAANFGAPMEPLAPWIQRAPSWPAGEIAERVKAAGLRRFRRWQGRWKR